MAFNGSGTYVRVSNWTSDANNGLPISATKFDADGTDVGNALSICLTRDGQGVPSGPLTWTQNLIINRAADATNLQIGRTGGANNPTLAFSLTDATNVSTITGNGLVVNASTGTMVFQCAGTQIGQVTTGGNWTIGRSATSYSLAIPASGDGTPAFEFQDEGASTYFDGGFRDIPQNIQNGTYGLVKADRGKQIYHSSGSAHTWTIPANASVAYPVGTAITFVNDGAGVVTLAITSDTLVWLPSAATGSRSLAQSGLATAIKVTSTKWWLTGSGLS